MDHIKNTSVPQATKREQWYKWEPPWEQREQRERSSCLGFSSSQRDGLRQSSAGRSAISFYLLLPTKPKHQKYQIVPKATKATSFASSLNSLCLLALFLPQFLISVSETFPSFLTFFKDFSFSLHTFVKMKMSGDREQGFKGRANEQWKCDEHQC